MFLEEVLRRVTELVAAFTFDEGMYVEVAALLVTLFIIRTLIGK